MKKCGIKLNRNDSLMLNHMCLKHEGNCTNGTILGGEKMYKDSKAEIN